MESEALERVKTSERDVPIFCYTYHENSKFVKLICRNLYPYFHM